MSHCKNCNYWEVGESYKEVNRCTYPKQLWDASEWVEDYSGKIINELNKETLAFVQDASDYCADLFTRAEFGCVAFVEKEL